LDHRRPAIAEVEITKLATSNARLVPMTTSASRSEQACALPSGKVKWDGIDTEKDR
jgi:hypothetical protein